MPLGANMFSAGSLGAIATGNVGASTRGRRRPNHPQQGPPGGSGTQGQPNWYDDEGIPWQNPPRPGIDYDPAGSGPTFDDYWDQIFGKRRGRV